VTEATRLTGRWTDVFRTDAMVHVALMASIVFATFQGYIKDRVAGPAGYILADGAFALAALVWFGTMALRRESIRGPGALPVLLLVIVGVPILYLIHPGTPLLVKLAGLRAWSVFPLAALIALSVVRNAGQLRAYTGLIIGLCIVTALYGIYQYTRGPEVLLDAGPLALERHGTSIYYSIGGTQGFRAFSTFTFPGPFAGMMVFGILLAAGIVVTKVWRLRARWLAALLIPLFFAGMTVSGTRAALIVLIGGLLTLAWFRRLSLTQLLLIPVAALAVHIGTIVTAGQITERYRSVLLQEGLLWTYLTLPVRTAYNYVIEYPFGLGLGRTGVGVPFAITSRMPRDYFVFTDGDIGRAGVELGIVGIAILVLILIALFRYIPWAIKTLRQGPAQDFALGAGSLVFATALLLLIGSPFSAVPHGIIWWFFFGALIKLALLEYDRQVAAQPEPAPA
jgi:hypothetical protein